MQSALEQNTPEHIPLYPFLFQVVAILKAIRNIRHLEDSLIDKLVHAAVDNSVKARVKSAILEAFTADPCSAKVRSYYTICFLKLWGTIIKLVYDDLYSYLPLQYMVNRYSYSNTRFLI